MRPLVIALILLLAGCGSPVPAPVSTASRPPPAQPTADLAATVTTLAATTEAITLATPPLPTTPPAQPDPTATLLPPASRLSTASPGTRPPRPTATPVHTATPLPEASLPGFRPVTQRLGPIGSGGADYTVEITLTNVRQWPGDRYHVPKPGTVYLIADIELRNHGPASIRHLTSFDFQMIDDNRAVVHAGLLPITDNCRLQLVELLPGGRLQACFGYQVLDRGRLEFIFAPAPRRPAGLTPGDYLSFPLR